MEISIKFNSKYNIGDLVSLKFEGIIQSTMGFNISNVKTFENGKKVKFRVDDIIFTKKLNCDESIIEYFLTNEKIKKPMRNFSVIVKENEILELLK